MGRVDACVADAEPEDEFVVGASSVAVEAPAFSSWFDEEDVAADGAVGDPAAVAWVLDVVEGLEEERSVGCGGLYGGDEGAFQKGSGSSGSSWNETMQPRGRGLYS